MLLAGHRAVSALVMEGRGLADTLEGPERHQLLSTCDNVERLTKELAELKARGMVRFLVHFFCHGFLFVPPIYLLTILQKEP